MNKEEFLKRLETEIKISKLSPYTLRNYVNGTKSDWNYITPLDFYKKYLLINNKNLLLSSR